MNVIIDVLKEHATTIKWSLLAATVATLFVVGVGSGAGIVTLRATMTLMLVLLGWQMWQMSVTGQTPLGRMCARVHANLLYWIAAFCSVKVLEAALVAKAGTVLAVISITFAAWLWGKLYGKGWLSRLSVQAHIFVTAVKFGAMGEPPHFEELDSQPVVLSDVERRRARRLVVLTITGGLVLGYVLATFMYALMNRIDSFDTLVTSSALLVAGGMVYIWGICAIYRIWDIAWHRRGIYSVSPWEVCYVIR